MPKLEQKINSQNICKLEKPVKIRKFRNRIIKPAFNAKNEINEAKLRISKLSEQIDLDEREISEYDDFDKLVCTSP